MLWPQLLNNPFRLGSMMKEVHETLAAAEEALLRADAVRLAVQGFVPLRSYVTKK